MKKEFNRNDLAAIKRAAASIAPLAAKRDKLIAKRDEVVAQIVDIEQRINSFNFPVVQMTGCTAEDLVTKDVDGKFIFRYPDTIIPDLIPEVKEEEVAEVVEAYDERAAVDEVETAPADAPFNPLN